MARVFSGVKPTGNPHLGNYIGAFRHFVTDQDEHDCIYCIVDLHAITLPIDPAELRDLTLKVAAIYLACGIDPERSTLFVQSHVPEHAELAWVLGCSASYGEMHRMTQFKDKSAKQGNDFIPFGLLAYPTLMASDILLYDAQRVPIGDDQKQHLELTRDIAQRFNARYGETFVIPEPAIATSGARVMDLQDPGNKMSKSEESPQGTIDLLDPPDAIRKKVKVAVTDSGREIVARSDKPAISNLLDIYAAASGSSVADLETAYAGKGYGDLKRDLADTLVAYLAPVRERYEAIWSDRSGLEDTLALGARKAQELASKKLHEVYERVGFVPRAR